MTLTADKTSLVLANLVRDRAAQLRRTLGVFDSFITSITSITSIRGTSTVQTYHPIAQAQTPAQPAPMPPTPTSQPAMPSVSYSLPVPLSDAAPSSGILLMLTFCVWLLRQQIRES